MSQTKSKHVVSVNAIATPHEDNIVSQRFGALADLFTLHKEAAVSLAEKKLGDYLFKNLRYSEVSAYLTQAEVVAFVVSGLPADSPMAAILRAAGRGMLCSAMEKGMDILATNSNGHYLAPEDLALFQEEVEKLGSTTDTAIGMDKSLALTNEFYHDDYWRRTVYNTQSDASLEQELPTELAESIATTELGSDFKAHIERSRNTQRMRELNNLIAQLEGKSGKEDNKLRDKYKKELQSLEGKGLQPNKTGWFGIPIPPLGPVGNNPNLDDNPVRVLANEKVTAILDATVPADQATSDGTGLPDGPAPKWDGTKKMFKSNTKDSKGLYKCDVCQCHKKAAQFGKLNLSGIEVPAHLEWGLHKILELDGSMMCKECVKQMKDDLMSSIETNTSLIGDGTVSPANAEFANEQVALAMKLAEQLKVLEAELEKKNTDLGSIEEQQAVYQDRLDAIESLPMKEVKANPELTKEMEDIVCNMQTNTELVQILSAEVLGTEELIKQVKSGKPIDDKDMPGATADGPTPDQAKVISTPATVNNVQHNAAGPVHQKPARPGKRERKALQKAQKAQKNKA